jgi:hypothetical protein
MKPVEQGHNRPVQRYSGQAAAASNNNRYQYQKKTVV